MIVLRNDSKTGRQAAKIAKFVGRPRRPVHDPLEPRTLLAAVPLSEQPPLISSDHAGPIHVELADLDGDGDADLLTASYLDGRIGWYENVNGQGRIGPLRLIASGAGSAAEVHAVDVDADGQLDVVVAQPSSNRVAWHRNQGGGIFGNAQIVTETAIETTAIAAGDLDGDGDVDLVSASSAEYDSDISWYENLDGQGQFGPQQIIAVDLVAPRSVVVADLDGDGDRDILSASYVGDSVAWYENMDGRATFSESKSVGSARRPVEVLAADVNGDQLNDVIVGTGYGENDSIVWFENVAADSHEFSPAQPIGQNLGYVESVQAIDLDGDADLDLLSSSFYDSKIAWFENTNGAGQFANERLVDHDWVGMAAAFAGDLDGDGDADIAMASFSDDIIAWVENDQLQFGPPTMVSRLGALGVDSIVTVDVDADGDRDVVAASVLDGHIRWWDNLGSGEFGSTQLVDEAMPGAIHVTAADINGDLWPDLLVSAVIEGVVVWYPNFGPDVGFGPANLLTNQLTHSESSTTADIDGDGDIDVIATDLYSYGGDNIVWFENRDGAGDFGPARGIENHLSNPREIIPVDIDGDLDNDLAVVSLFDNRVAWFENLDGQGNFGPQRIVSGEHQTPVALDAGDIDGNGSIDLLVASFNDDRLRWFPNTDGLGTFGEALLVGDAARGPEAVHLADLDGDGDLDVLVTSVVDDSVSWHENTDGLGSFGPIQAIDRRATGAGDVTTDDLDGDGDLDVVAALYDLSRVVWYRNDSVRRGDVTGDGQLSHDDVDALCAAIRAGESEARFDLSGDGKVDVSDMTTLIEDIFQTTFGDANLDGQFNSQDLVLVFTAGQYEDQVIGNSDWAVGDWNCDGEFSSDDLVLALQRGRYESAARPSAPLSHMALALQDDGITGPRKNK